MRVFPDLSMKALIKAMLTSADELKVYLACYEVVELSMVQPGKKKWVAKEWGTSER